MTVWQEYLLEIYDEIKVLIVGIGFLSCVVFFPIWCGEIG